MAELAKRFEMQPDRITAWKKEFLTLRSYIRRSAIAIQGAIKHAILLDGLSLPYISPVLNRCCRAFAA